MASGEDADIVARIKAATGDDLSDLELGASTDQRTRLVEDVKRLRDNPHIAGRALVGGFFYDVDTGALTQIL
jgi:carbonic anhydrase